MGVPNEFFAHTFLKLSGATARTRPLRVHPSGSTAPVTCAMLNPNEKNEIRPTSEFRPDPNPEEAFGTDFDLSFGTDFDLSVEQVLTSQSSSELHVLMSIRKNSRPQELKR